MILYLCDNGNNDKGRNHQTPPQSQMQYVYKDMTRCVSWYPPQIELALYHQTALNAMRGDYCIENNSFNPCVARTSSFIVSSRSIFPITRKSQRPESKRVFDPILANYHRSVKRSIANTPRGISNFILKLPCALYPMSFIVCLPGVSSIGASLSIPSG